MDVNSKPLSPQGPSRKMRTMLEPGGAARTSQSGDEKAKNSIKKPKEKPIWCPGLGGVCDTLRIYPPEQEFGIPSPWDPAGSVYFHFYFLLQAGIPSLPARHIFFYFLFVFIYQGHRGLGREKK